MKNSKLCNISTLFISLVIVLLVCVIGCTPINTYGFVPYSDNEIYKVFTSDETDLSVSFQYPSYYYVSDRLEPGNPRRDLRLMGTTMEEFAKGKVNEIFIHITYPKDGFPFADTAVDNHISDRKWEFHRNFRLIQKARVIFRDLEGWETIITYRERPFGAAIDLVPREPAFIVQRDIFFDYQDMVWQISLFADVKSYDGHAKNDFEHVLNTMKFQ